MIYLNTLTPILVTHGIFSKKMKARGGSAKEKEIDGMGSHYNTKKKQKTKYNDLCYKHRIQRGWATKWKVRKGIRLTRNT